MMSDLKNFKKPQLKHLLLLILLINFSKCIARRNNNNVCPTFKDYQTIRSNRNCSYNPDVGAEVPEIVTRYGFPFEVYKVRSEDGYIIGLFRIPHNGTNINLKRRPVLLHHGLLTDSACWLIIGNKSLPFDLSRKGFDVWLVNGRGSFYSSDHVTYSVEDKEYWDFSFHEMAVFDLPKIIDFVAAKTKQRGELRYIGHSMGTTIFFIYSSLRPRHAFQNVKKFVALAPAAYFKSFKGGAQFILPFTNQIINALYSAGIYGVGKNFEPVITLLRRLCSAVPIMGMCMWATVIFSGLNNDELLMDLYPVAFSTFPAPFSVKVIEHYVQLATSKRFQFFDYGFRKNFFRYRSAQPPEYPLERIKVPSFLIYGRNDWLSVQQDVEELYRKLKCAKKIMNSFNFDHMNFAVGRHATNLYKIIIDYILDK